MSNKRNVNSYSPEGRIYQLEFAMKASTLGTTSLAFTHNNKTYIISEKKCLSKHQIPPTKHYKIFDHIMLTYSGIAGDAKTIIKKAREYSLYHYKVYNENVPIEGLLKYLCRLALQFGEKDFDKKIFSRPFGCSILICGYEDEPVIFSYDPSGSYRKHKIVCIGNGSESVEMEVESVEKGVKELMRVMKDEMRSENVEIWSVDENEIKVFGEDELERVINVAKAM